MQECKSWSEIFPFKQMFMCGQDEQTVVQLDSGEKLEGACKYCLAFIIF